MKKVVLCVPSLLTGGAERFTSDLALNIDKLKYTVIVAVTRIYTDSPLKCLLEENGITVIDLSGKNYPQMLKKQLCFFKTEKPDVIHAQIGSVLHMMLACKLCNIPIRLYTVHNEAKLLYGKSKIKKKIYKLAFSFFGFKPIAICPTVKQTLVEDMNLEEKNITIVNNGVDVHRFTPANKFRDNGTIRIISVGTLYWIKNQLMTITAVCAIHEMGYKIELILLGDGEDREKIREVIKKNNAQDFIFPLGTKKNVEDYLRKSDIYVSASKTEGLPLSILEAMACGLPIIATNAGGTKDIVHNGENGFLVKVDDVRELQSALLKLIKSPTMRKNFSKTSRRIAEEWSAENCTHGYEKLYNE